MSKALPAWLLKLAVTGGMLAWLLSRPEIRHGLARQSAPDALWMIAGFVSAGLGQIFTALRWNAALAVTGLGIPFNAVLRITLIGTGAGFLSVGSLGNDAVRVALAARRRPGNKKALVGSIGLDHLSAFPGFLIIGLLVLGTIGAPGMLGKGVWVALIAPLVLFFAVGFVIRRWFPHKHDRIWNFVSAPGTRRGFVRAALHSLPALFFHHGAFYCAARAVGVSIPPAGFFGAAAAADVVASLPVSFAGLGVREKAFETLLGRWFGVAPADAVALSLLGLAIIMMWGVAGALCFLAEPSAGSVGAEKECGG